MIPLFERFPKLRDGLPYVPIAELPTPVEQMEKLGAAIGADRLYVKRDDLSGLAYGGNKVRKLVFLLAKAQEIGAKEVMTFGAAGSNHALATAVYARQLGLQPISMLFPQINADYVQKNLLMSHGIQTELNHYPGISALLAGALYQMARHKIKTGRFPFYIPAGGTNARGIVGFVDAAFELKEQIRQGLLPEPDIVYAAFGSGGTAAGLMIGFAAAGMKTKVIPVRVVQEAFVPEKGFRKQIMKAVSFLHEMDSSFPDIDFSKRNLYIDNDFLGKGYAAFTEAGKEAMELAKENEEIVLDGTYTGKAMAALIAHGRKGLLKNKVVLYWNTKNSRDFSEKIADVDYRELPKAFHTYFKKA
jgi:1-aminocyclopropane-1-carboxylate deaminase/D-cysteine desulfhydrase-like pyridoxal-dependent ACC family enzyme